MRIDFKYSKNARKVTEAFDVSEERSKYIWNAIKNITGTPDCPPWEAIDALFSLDLAMNEFIYAVYVISRVATEMEAKKCVEDSIKEIKDQLKKEAKALGFDVEKEIIKRKKYTC